MCASENIVLHDKLVIPQSHRGLNDNIVVVHVKVENHSAYAEAVANADDTRWET